MHKLLMVFAVISYISVLYEDNDLVSKLCSGNIVGGKAVAEKYEHSVF